MTDTQEVKGKSPIKGALWLRNRRLGEWLQAPVSPFFETFLLPILANARQSAGRGRLRCRIRRAWRVLEPAYTVINGYFYARADPKMKTVLRQPPNS